MDVVSLGAGSIAGALGVGIAYPLDTLKVKAQVYAGTGSRSMGGFKLMRRIFSEEGLAGFYQGVSPTMAGQALIKGVAFFAYESAKAQLEIWWGTNLGLGGLAIAAAVSGAVVTFVATPVERIKVVMQASSASTFSSPIQCVKDVVRDDGLDGLLFRGFGATLLREVPAYSGYYLAYEVVSSYLLAFSCPQFLTSLLGGAAAGVACWVPVYPIDVVKTNLQASVDSGGGYSFVSATRSLYASGGVGAFWDGIGPKLLRAVVNHAATFVLFDQIVALFATS
jgi:solute carrier family 25 carnitine/acylcarnitine transporter 20/29